MRLTTVGRGGSWVQRGGAFVVRGSLCWRCGRGARPSGRLAVAAPLRPLAARSLVCAPRVLARAPAPDSYDTSIETREGRRVPRPLRPCTASLRLRTLRLVAARASSTRGVDRLGGSADARVDVGTASLRDGDEAVRDGDEAVLDGDEAVLDGDEAVLDGDEAVQWLSERPRRRCVARRLRLASRNARPGPTPGADPTSRCASWGGVARYGVRALTQRLHAAPRGANTAWRDTRRGRRVSPLPGWDSTHRRCLRGPGRRGERRPGRLCRWGPARLPPGWPHGNQMRGTRSWRIIGVEGREVTADAAETLQSFEVTVPRQDQAPAALTACRDLAAAGDTRPRLPAQALDPLISSLAPPAAGP